MASRKRAIIVGIVAGVVVLLLGEGLSVAVIVGLIGYVVARIAKKI